MLKETNSIVAGSFPLQIYLNETWNSSDMDIFTHDRSVLSFFGIDPEDTNNKNEIGRTYNSIAAYKNFCDTLYEVRHNGLRVQIILSDKLDMIENFDFDVCKIYFDGSKKYHTEHHDAITSKTITFNVDRKATNTSVFRLEKYEYRGFTMKDKDEFLKLYNGSSVYGYGLQRF